MNKSELAEAVANAASLSKADGARALDAVIESITSTLKSGDTVSLVGFGNFQVKASSFQVRTATPPGALQRGAPPDDRSRFQTLKYPENVPDVVVLQEIMSGIAEKTVLGRLCSRSWTRSKVEGTRY